MSIRSKLLSAALATALSAGLATSVFAQDLLIKDATVVIPDGRSADTDVLIQGGRIIAIGTDIAAPTGVPVHDGTGHWVSPGLFASYSALGLVEVGAEGSTNDTTASGAKTSVSERAVDSFNPRSVHIANVKRRGITHMVSTGSASGDSIFAGTGLIASTEGDFDSVVKDAAFVHVALGETGSNRAGGSRAAAIAQLRAALSDALNYRTKYSSPTDGDALARLDAAALSPAARGNIPLLISANQASDLLTLTRLKKEFPRLNMIVVGGAEAWQVTDALKEAGIKIILDPVQNLPEGFEQRGASYDNVMILDAEGVDYAISNLSSFRVAKAAPINQHAGNAVGNGLDWDKAFAAITSTPRAWFGLPRSEIQTGPISTLVVWDGDPLEATSAPLKLWIDGEEQSLTSRQTLLRDRYNPTSTDTRPHKYRN
jgi:imidazolonepropionase-like amidohydrolase